MGRQKTRSRTRKGHGATALRTADQERACFWKWMRYLLSPLLTILTAFFIYMLTTMTAPMGEIRAELRELAKTVDKLTSEDTPLERASDVARDPNREDDDCQG